MNVTGPADKLDRDNWAVVLASHKRVQGLTASVGVLRAVDAARLVLVGDGQAGPYGQAVSGSTTTCDRAGLELLALFAQHMPPPPAGLADGPAVVTALRAMADAADAAARLARQAWPDWADSPPPA